MQVTKRDGEKEPVSLDKITKRISDMCDGLEHVDPIVIAIDTVKALYDGITTRELDILSADICAGKSHHYPDYAKLGGRILASNIIKSTDSDYMTVVESLFLKKILSEDFFQFIKNNPQIQSFFDYSRDFLFD